MEIREINLKHFGKFEQQTMQFHAGVNVIYGENETGKSTVCSFIRGMFFGIEKARGRAARNDEYHMRQPWENPAYFAGSIRFVSGGKTFFLDRSFYSNEKRIRLICEDDGEELDPVHGDLDALLEDMNQAAFSNTFYYGNRTGETDAALAEEIRNYMVNAATGNLSRFDVTKAREKLNKERRAIEAEKKRLIEEDTIAAHELQIKMEYENQEIEALAEEERKCREALRRFELEQEEEPNPENGYEELETGDRQERRPWIIGKIAAALAAASGLGLGILSPLWQAKVAAVVMILLACIGVRIFAAKDQQAKDDVRERDLRKREEELLEAFEKQNLKEKRKAENEPKRQRLLTNLEWVQNSRREKESVLRELQEQYSGLQQKKTDRDEMEIRIAALNLAEKTLMEVSADIYEEYEDRLNERISAILSEITGGRYDRILVDENLMVKIYAGDRILTPEQVSRGTMEQICFALRMAIGEILNPGEPLPIILDDAFLTYDDIRLENTLNWLKKCGRQVLLFTCQKREQELLR